MIPRLGLLALVSVVACGDSATGNATPTPPGNMGASFDGGSDDASSAGDASNTDAGVTSGCATGEDAVCVAWNKRTHCVPSTSGGSVVTETCPAGCFDGKCSAAACADECVLGSNDAGAACKLWDLGTHAFVPVDAAGKLHDRARDYDRLLRATNLPEGQVMNAHFTDASFAHVTYYDGYHDAAIWTGSALAAEAWRLMATGDPDAANQVSALVHTLHTAFTVSGDPAYLARLAVPSSSTITLDTASPCADPEWHCIVPFGGKTLNWLGATSRDQYTGVLLGYYVAYLATNDEALRAIIREDLVAVATELMKTRPAVPAAVVIDGIPINKSLALENVILVPSEMTGGKVQITLSTSAPSEAHIAGFREFFPDYSVLTKQLIGVSVSVPRPSTSIMIGAIMKLALLTTDGVPSSKVTHDAIQAYYTAHADSWLTLAAGWSFSANCGNGYFANHIAFIMAHVYAMLEKDPVLLPRIRDTVLGEKMWGALKGHKNPYFTFLWGATQAAPAAADLSAATTELGQFSVGPRVHVPRSSISAPEYLPHDTTCTSPLLCDTATLAVDVKDRVVDDFLWQRQPWQLADSGSTLQVYPGVDYLAAYWAGRAYGFIADDDVGTCARYDR